jgi:hypothetical protein
MQIVDPAADVHASESESEHSLRRFDRGIDESQSTQVTAQVRVIA